VLNNLKRYAWIAAVFVAVLAVWHLESARQGLTVKATTVGQTPVTVYEPSADAGPTIVVSHGFAGSRQIMSAYSLHLAQAGYRVVVFDYEGHGTHPVPMSGDVTSVDGTTRRLVNQTLAVIAWAASSDPTGQPVGQLGHSMATDVVIRAAQEAEQPIGPIVALSAFSGAVTPTEPPDLLLIAGEWEARLREFGIDAVQMVDPEAGEGDLITRPDLRRQAIIAPKVEHVGILYSQTAQAEALAWMNTFYGRDQTPAPLTVGPWLLLLLSALVVLGRRVVTWPARLHADLSGTSTPLRPWQLAACVLIPALVAPAISVLIDIDALPVLVADYLLVHLMLYGALALGLMWWFGARFGSLRSVAAILLPVWGIAVFGFALHRYGANFWPAGPRVLIVAALLLGTVPFAIADAILTEARAWWVRALMRITFVASLMLAVALDFDRLFFLVLIAPIIVLFFAIFGPLGRWTAQSSGSLAAGLGLGVILAWALGVTFPLFEAV